MTIFSPNLSNVVDSQKSFILAVLACVAVVLLALAFYFVATGLEGATLSVLSNCAPQAGQSGANFDWTTAVPSCWMIQ